MLYILHHAKGALLLSAGDRDQVLEWSQRQLGRKARLVSVVESNCREAVNTVEKDGTGISAEDGNGCLPLIGIMANLTQDVSRGHGCSSRPDALNPGSVPIAEKITWH